ncbi:MAG: hypothetical protein QNJ51_04940 [Calothrix sp. MO_167.B12]|nr:hypothetical protein [Calothrix sp. MO_167.B12]
MRELLMNVAANIISTLILALIGFIAYGYLYWKNRKEILNFFGVSNSKPNICIYVSNLNVREGGTSGIEPIDKGYVGSAITKLEYDGALLIQNELKAKPLALLPKRLQDWLGQENLELRTIDAPIKISPPKPILNSRDTIFNDHLVVMGTGIYNSLSHYYLKEYFRNHEDIYRFYFYHKKNDKGQRIIGIRQHRLADSTTDEGRDKHIEPAFIQKFYDVERQIYVFICAGLGSSATLGSARYLSENWRDLQRKFGNKDFGIGLLFRNQDPDGESVGKPEIFYENYLQPSKSL